MSQDEIPTSTNESPDRGGSAQAVCEVSRVVSLDAARLEAARVREFEALHDDEPRTSCHLLAPDGTKHEVSIMQWDAGFEWRCTLPWMYMAANDSGRAAGGDPAQLLDTMRSADADIRFASTGFARDLFEHDSSNLLTSLIENVDKTPPEHDLKSAQRAQRIQAFWGWFAQNEPMLHEVELDESGFVRKEHMERIVTLGDACNAVDSDLSMEIETSHEGSKTLVISANGIPEVFPVVEEMFDLMPPLQKIDPHGRWSFVKYRQRQHHLKPLQLKGTTVRPQDLQFGIGQHPATGEFAIFVFVAGFDSSHPEQSEVLRHIGFIFLDLILGEFDVATKVAAVDFLTSSERPDIQRIDHTELPTRFDALYSSSFH